MTNNTIVAAEKRGDKIRSWIVADEPVAALPNIRTHAFDLSYVFLGKLSLMGSNALLMLLLARVMELRLYGVLVAAISGQLLLSRLLLLGVDFGMIRLRTLPELGESTRKIVRAGLLVICYATGAFALIVIALGIISFWLPIPVWLVLSIFAGGVGTALVDYYYCYRLAEQQYRAAGLVQSGTGIARLIVSSAAVLLIPALPYLVFAAYPAASLLSGLGLTVDLGRKNPLAAERSLVQRLLRFSLWLGAANVAAILSLYLGTFLLLAFGQEAENGIFGLCLTLSMGFFALYNAFGEYLASRIARLESANQIPGFLARWVGVGLAIAAACIPVVIVIAMILPRFLPPEFAGMSGTLYFLTASMLVLLVQVPLQCACVYMLRPNVVVFGWVIRVCFAALLSVILAYSWGAWGASVAQLGASIASLLAFTVFVIVGLRSNPAAEAGTVALREATGRQRA